jgi:predicted helicase
MRESLTTTFGAALLIDLHGNSKRKETTPTGQPDENVFDIQQGVAVSIWRRFGCKPPNPFVHLDLWGDRQQKYSWLLAHSVSNAGGEGVHPASPTYLLKPRQAELDDEYASALSLPEIFPVNSLGIATARDHLAVKWSSDEVWETVRRFAKLRREEAREEFELGPDARDWKVELAQGDVNDSGPSRRCIQPILYRPFDSRFTYYTGHSRGFHCMPRNEVMQHLVGGGNLGLIGARGVEVAREYDQVFCTRSIIQLHTLSIKEVNYLFPLFIRENGNQRQLTTAKRPKETSNFSDEFLREIKAVGLPSQTDASMAAFHYIYAVLYSKSYRSRYEQDLKAGFARIPVTRLMPLFIDLAQCGADLVALHLLEADYPFASWNKRPSTSTAPFGSSQPRISGRGPSSVGTGFPRFEERRVLMNESRWFEPVSEVVWAFRIGGYQVCEKWLKDRREMDLSVEDTDQYRQIVAALGRTIETMERIEKIISKHGGWPLPNSRRESGRGTTA